MKKSKLIRQVAVAFAIVFMSAVLCGAGCSNVASDSGGGTSGGGGGTSGGGGGTSGGGGGVGSGGGGASSTMTGLEAIAAIKALQSGGSITIKLGSSVKTISTDLQSALRDPNKKVTLDLSQSGVTSIGEEAFIACYSLTSVKIPSVTSIGVGAFEGCRLLNTIKYTGSKSDWNAKITSFGIEWRKNVPALGVTCSDGKTYKFAENTSSSGKLGDEITG